MVEYAEGENLVDRGYKYRRESKIESRRRDIAVKGCGDWPMIPGGGSACVDSLINFRSRENVQDIAVGWG